VAILRFGAFELDVRGGELRRSGVLIRLSPQQFRLLRYLAEHAGQICGREDIQREIWGSEVFVDFDRGLNVCIAQIRAALNDDSEAPRFIQTVPRKGYRFVAPVELVAPVEQVTGLAGSAPPPTPQWPGPARFRSLAVKATLVLVCAGLAFVVASLWLPEHRTMLAVMPFENLTQRPEDGPAIDGLVDELITQFGGIDADRLGVIGRTSVMRYAGRRPGLAEVGRDLAVDYVVEGSFRSEGDRMRVSVRFVKVADQAQIWSDTYEQQGAGRLEMQEEIAARVTVAVVRRLFPRSPPPVPTAHVPNAAAREAFANGRYLQHKNSRADAERAIAWFAQAGERDPEFAEPWAAMAETYIRQAMSGAVSGNEAFPKARAAAERALRLTESAEAHNALADVSFWFDWNWNAARTHFERAIALNPSLAQAHHDYAFYLVAMGRAPAGLASLRRAIAIDPLSPQVNLDAGWLLLQAHRFDEAIRQARRALELEPGLTEANGCIGRALVYQGKAGPDVMEFYRRLAAGSGNAYYRALALAVLGQKADALRELEAAYAQHSTMMPLVGTEPAFAGLHEDARFREIARKVGLTPGGRP
jgi:TolB-like protein/DNA-binding winged helix-turn-helix (wHTH) protein/Tfp pilus assembly protein PilF